jgi:uncharacterized protein (TIGR03435 family)
MKRARIWLFCASCAIFVVSITQRCAPTCVDAQTASSDPSFDVATIKPVTFDAAHPFDPAHFWAHVYQARASYWSMTLDSLVTYAYSVQQFQVSGPEWTNADRFDIEARFPKGAAKVDEKDMLRALLKDRFKLAFHIEKRELDGYVLVVGKHGAKLRPSLPDLAKPETDSSLTPANINVGEEHAKPEITSNSDGSSTLDRGIEGTQTVKFDQKRWATHYEISKMTMEELAGRLTGCLGSGVHYVEDRTGIKGNYQVAFDCPLGTARSAISGDTSDTLPSDPQASSSLSQSLSALGLKLLKHKILLDVYVIDHVEKPSAN